MILAFDCATATGWCAGDGSTTPVLGNVKMPSSVEPGPFLDFWEKWLDRHLDEIKPTVVVFEAPILPQKTNISTVRKLVGLAGVLEMVAFRKRVVVEETNVSHIKKVLTGNGRSEKPDMVRMAKKCGLNPKSFDEADAFGVWICAVHHHAKQHQQAWDKKLYSGSALL